MTTYTRTTGNEGQTSEQKRPPLKWIVNFPNEKLSKLERPCFVAACHGNEKMATLLNYFIYEASREAEKLKVNLESCSDITLELSQDEILRTLKYASKKTLIGHLDKFNEWGYVGSRKYGRTYTVHFKAVQHAIDNPPAKEDKKGRTSQSCSATTSQKRQHSKVVDDEMLYQLQQNVVELQLKVVELQQKVVNLQLSQSREIAPPLAPYTIYDAYRLLDCNRLIETIDNNESSEKHTFVSSDTAHASLSQDEQVFTDEKPPQGDEHAAVASGHSHRVGDAAAPGDDTSHTAVPTGQVATPEDRPVLEAQEIDNEGEHHASRVPTLPAANPAAHSERAVSRPDSDHSRDITHPDNGLPVVRPVGSSTASGVGSREADIQRPVGKDRTAQVAETPTTTMPAQSLSLPQAEQAALGARQSTKAEKKTGKAEPVKPEFTPEGEALYRDWCSLFHVTIPKTKAIILAANELAEPITIWAEQKLGISKAEVLKRIMNWLYKNNANYYGEGRGVKLYDIHRDFEEWQSAAERKLAKDALKVVVSPAEDKSRIFSMEPIILPSRTHKGGLRGKAVATTH